MTDRQRVQYVAGYWQLPGNAKRDPAHYLQHIPRSLAMIAGQPLLLFHDDPAIAERFVGLSEPLGIDLRMERVPIAELPANRDADAFVAACRSMPRSGPNAVPADRSEKGHVHYTRDLQESGEATYRALIVIWMSKVALTARTAAEGTGDASFTAWMDVSIARFNDQRSNWEFARQPYAQNALNHYASPMRFMGRRLPLNASFLLASPEVWAEIDREFQAELLASLSQAYAHDEETILGLVHHKRPELFHTLGVPNALLQPQIAPSRGTRLLRALKRRLSNVIGGA